MEKLTDMPAFQIGQQDRPLGTKKILQCHSRGDKRFSPFFCPVEAFGIVRSIESHYQLAKRFQDKPAPQSWKDCKQWQKAGIRQVQWQIGNVILPVKTDPQTKGFAIDDWGVQWYIALWEKYLHQHPEVVAIAAQYDGFEDPFEGTFPFGQAKVFELVSRQGTKALRPMWQPLYNLLKMKWETPRKFEEMTLREVAVYGDPEQQQKDEEDYAKPEYK